jgi:7-carboxy-7-deazaguanine synthase
VTRLKITEIFYSLQGEADTAGVPTAFVRLTGCPLRCQYCDTAYAFYGGEWWDAERILVRIKEFGTRYVCVTGGEPLAQKGCVAFLTQLCDAGLRVSLETSGAMPLAEVDPRVVKVVATVTRICHCSVVRTRSSSSSADARTMSGVAPRSRT